MKTTSREGMFTNILRKVSILEIPTMSMAKSLLRPEGSRRALQQDCGNGPAYSHDIDWIYLSGLTTHDKHLPGGTCQVELP